MDWTANKQLVRLAFVNEWSDALVSRLVDKAVEQGQSEEEILKRAMLAAENLTLSVLREGDCDLDERAANAFGFSSKSELDAFNIRNPMLSVELHAHAGWQACSGIVEAISSTEVVFQSEDGRRYFVDATKAQGAEVGCLIEVGDFGQIRVKDVPCAPRAP